MDKTNHIQKLTVDLHVASQDAGRELQESTSRICRSELPDVLDEVFAKVALHERIVFDRIDLELPGYADEDAFRRSFLNDVRDLLAKRLAEERPAAGMSSHADAWRAEQSGYYVEKIEEVMFHFLLTGALPWNADDIPRQDLVSSFIDVLQRLPSIQRRLQKLLLDSAVARDRLVRQCKDLELARMLTTFEQKPFSPAAVESTLTLFRFLSEVYRRIAVQTARWNPRVRTWNLLIEAIAFSAVHSDASESVAFARAIGFVVRSVGEVLEDLHHSSATTQQVQGLIEQLQNVFEGPASEALRSRSELRPALERAGTRLVEFGSEFQERRAALERPPGIPADQTAKPEQLLESKLAKNPDEQPAEKVAVAQPVFPRPAILWQPDTATHNVPPRGHGDRQPVDGHASDAQTPQRTPRAHDDIPKAGILRDESRTDAQPVDALRQEPQAADTGSQTQRLSIPYHVAPVDANSKFYVDNAGLVLLAPFLRQFFDKLGLLDDTRAFLNEAAQVRAVMLTQYFIDWGEETPEYKLLLNKLLCGYEPMAPIDLEFEIGPDEKAEVEDLLGSVIQAWTSLKNTSVDGFRTSFLPRQGILTYNGSTWQLQVERTGIDVLLDTVPWTYSIVKHPWMESPIMVEW